MAGAAAMGLWTFRTSELTDLGAGFWAWTFVGWTLTSFLGSTVSALSNRSQDTASGALNGITTWALSSTFVFLFAGFSSGRIFGMWSVNPLLPSVFGWAAFGDLIALSAAIAGGIFGSSRELFPERPLTVPVQTSELEVDPVSLVLKEHLSMRDHRASESPTVSH
jgi:hypothetical protein